MTTLFDASRDLDTLKEIPSQIDTALRTWQQERQKINAMAELSETGKGKKARDADRAVRAEVDRLRAMANDLENRIKQTVTAATPMQQLTVEQELLSELKKSRTWARAKTLLDSGDLLLGSIESLIKSAQDRTALEALREELPVYLRSKKEVQWTGAALGAIAKAEEPYLSADEKQARAILEGTKSAMGSVGFTLGTTRTLLPPEPWPGDD